MKNIIFTILLLVTSFSYSQIFGNDPEINIDNLAPESTWQIIEMALHENEMTIGEFKPSEGLLISEWITWTSLMISNRARLYFKQEGTTITLRIGDRSYESDKGWSEAIGKLSKKKYKAYVQSVADKINEINKNPDLIRKAIKTSKLIPAFNPINKLAGTEWKLLEAIQTEQSRPELKFQVTNLGTKDIKLKYIGGEFQEMSGIGTARLQLTWENTVEDDYKTTILKSNETTIVNVIVGKGYSLQSAIGFVMNIRFYIDNNQTEKPNFNIYNMPIPYKYSEGD